MSRNEFKFGILNKNVLSYGLNTSRREERTALRGSVVKVEGNLGNGNVIIKYLDKTSRHFEESEYYIDKHDIIAIAEKLWPLLLALPSLVDRIYIALNSDLCDFLVSIKVNDNIDVLYGKIFYPAIVKYIGPVEAMGFGYFLGLELVSLIQITKGDGSYAGKHYFSALPGTALFVSVDKIQQVVTYLASAKRNLGLFDSQTPHDPSFIVLDKPRNTIQKSSTTSENEVDLIELIGGSWPGVTDKVNTTNESSIRTVRNKSVNPVSHLISGKKIVKVQPKNDLITDVDAYSNTAKINSDTSEVDEQSVCDPTPTPSTSDGLSIGTLVEVVTDISEPLYGVVRWLGNGIAGIELEEDHDHLPLELTDGVHQGHRRFSCAPGRALFVPTSQCQRDSRFDDAPQSLPNSSKMFGQVDSPVVPGAIPPLSMPTEEDVLAVCGKYRGIQGHHNSCYLDATLFAMFTYTGVFDSLLFRPRAPNDIPHYEEVQRVLREEIVNPLRKNLYVRADRVMKLRTLLEDLSSVSGLTSEEKDPEEFLNSLLAQILKAEPFLKLSSGQEAFYYQLFVEKDEGLILPSVQQLFEQSFLSSDIKLKEVPSCLIIQMPRFGKNFKMYSRILPSQLLDVTDIIENSPRQCTVCGELAAYECRECFGQCGVGLESTAFCEPCLSKAHAHSRRSSHAPRPLAVPPDFAVIAEHCPPPRLYMELFAVVCIETSHYVAFVKCGSGHEAPWCFFDSMADRKGEQNGYNIPEMVACGDVSTWLSDDGAASRALQDKQLPEHARRLLCDAYICMYQSPDVMMYR